MSTPEYRRPHIICAAFAAIYAVDALSDNSYPKVAAFTLLALYFFAMGIQLESKSVWHRYAVNSLGAAGIALFAYRLYLQHYS